MRTGAFTILPWPEVRMVGETSALQKQGSGRLSTDVVAGGAHVMVTGQCDHFVGVARERRRVDAFVFLRLLAIPMSTGRGQLPVSVRTIVELPAKSRSAEASATRKPRWPL